MRIALDTNVIVSAVATRGLCADLFQVILLEHELVLGETVLAELRQVVRRKLKLPPETVNDLERFLRRRATIVAAGDSVLAGSLDRADAAVLGEAVAGNVDLLVTGDRKLLEVADAPVTTVSPRGLWELIRRAT